MTFANGQKIGAYRVIRLLGKGGMGVVYEVEHEQLGVRYALKAFTRESGHVDVLKNKFLSEGKILARLRDPHLVRVFDLNFDAATGIPYFVMDLVLSEDGSPRTLADVKTAELDEERILRWFGELAAALDYIHGQGVVHRDIKLGNVLLSADGHVVLSDFGVSRLFSERLRSDVNAVNTVVADVGTGDRLVMGTQGYVAPEVVRGEAATPAADAYSLGVLLVYLLTGIWYEPGSKVFKLLGTLECRWVDVLPRLLSDDPAERPAKLGELVESLRGVPAESAAHGGADAPRPPQRGRGPRPALLVGVVASLVAVVAVGVLLLARRSDPPAADDAFDETFGVRGIYESPSK